MYTRNNIYIYEEKYINTKHNNCSGSSIYWYIFVKGGQQYNNCYKSKGHLWNNGMLTRGVTHNFAPLTISSVVYICTWHVWICIISSLLNFLNFLNKIIFLSTFNTLAQRFLRWHHISKWEIHLYDFWSNNSTIKK